MSRPRFRLGDFSMTPRELKEHLDLYVYGQETAKRALATTVVTHYRRLRQERNGEQKKTRKGKTTLLLIGPTGTGKTYLAELAAAYIGVPCAIGDASTMTTQGVVGSSAEDLPRNLYQRAERDGELASKGMIYVDEVDKLVSGQSGPLSFSHHSVHKGLGVQLELLKLMEGRDVDLFAPHPVYSTFSGAISTRDMLFIFSGAFEGLDTLIEKEAKGASVGFVSARSGSPSIGHITNALHTYGFNKQFLGRVGITTSLQPFSEEDLYQILCLPTCIALTKAQEDFAAYGITLDLTDDAKHAIAARALKYSQGARALQTVIDELLFDALYTLSDLDIQTVTINAAFVENPERKLEEICVDSSRKENGVTTHVVQAGTIVVYANGEASYTGHAYNEGTYREALQRLGVDERYISDALQYCQNQKKTPDAIPGLITSLERGIDVSCALFQESAGKKLVFDESARQTLVGIALNMGKSEIDRVFNWRVGQYVTDTAFLSKYRGQEIVITGPMMFDLRGSLNRMVASE